MAIETKPGKIEGDVYFASEETIGTARVKDWDAVADKARGDLRGLLGGRSRGAGMVQEVGQGPG